MVIDSDGNCYTSNSDGNLESTAKPDGTVFTFNKDGSLQQSFTYNSSNELVRVDDKVTNKSVAYAYDFVGNITSVKTYLYTTGALGSPLTTQNYTYNSQNQRTDLGYDASGNLTSLNGYTFTWSGRRLTAAVNANTNISYTYNHNGIRTSKTVNGTTTYYEVDENNNVVKQYELVNDAETNVIEFVYDSSNSPIYFTYNNATYYYEKNLQGDIVAILDGSGNTVVEYTYDIWGKLVSVTGSLADTVGAINPLRYRGYYYDTETQLYYLQSRYYSPDLMRFISQDDPVFSNAQGEPLGSNLYVYCGNSPIMFYDYLGYIKINIKWLDVAIDIAIWAIPALLAISRIWKSVSKSASKLVSFGNKLISMGRTLFKRFDNRIYCAFAKDSTYRIVRTIGVLAGAITIVSSVGNIVEYIIDILDGKWDGYLNTSKIKPKFDFTRDY